MPTDHVVVKKMQKIVPAGLDQKQYGKGVKNGLNDNFFLFFLWHLVFRILIWAENANPTGFSRFDFFLLFSGDLPGPAAGGSCHQHLFSSRQLCSQPHGARRSPRNPCFFPLLICP